MLKLFKQAVEFLLFSNVFIAICALAFYLLTFYQLGTEPVFDIMAVIVFAATLFVYIFQRLIVLRLHKVVQNRRQIWFYKHLNLMKVISIACFIFLCISVFFITFSQFLALAGVGFISILYGVPLSNKKFRIRDLGIIKIFLIAFAWAYISTVLPLVTLGEQLFSTIPFLIFLERLFFIFAITLPFDIRDLEIDKLYRLRTIPALIGEKATKFISIFLLTLMILISFIEITINVHSNELAVFIGLVISGIITMIVILKGKDSFSDYYYLGILDGMILLQFLLVAGFVYLF